MEVYTLDSLLRRDQVIDKFDSLIWAERWRDEGDFELSMSSTIESRSRLKVGGLLAMNESYRVMIIEQVEDKTGTDGQAAITAKGRSLESLLRSRVAKASLSDLTTEPKWVITGKATDVARTIFHDICVAGTLSAADIIPFIVEGTFLPGGTIAEPSDDITTDLDPTTVYDAIKDLADNWNFGFRILRFFDSSQLYFDLTMGSDRTAAQTDLSPVIFTPEMDNLQNTSELTTITNAKNVAYVFSPAGFQVVYGPETDTTVSGFDRRVLVVNATDITSDNPDVEAALAQRGREELSKNRAVSAFDGEIDPNSSYKYDVDYSLGDLVENRNTDGVRSYMRVTEQIFTSDREGDRRYPTLALNTFVTTGSWTSMGLRVWDDMGADEFWSTQP
jgi:hypothetical protein